MRVIGALRTSCIFPKMLFPLAHSAVARIVRSDNVAGIRKLKARIGASPDAALQRATDLAQKSGRDRSARRLNRSFAGNIRELQNSIGRAVLFSPGSLRLPLDLTLRSESLSRTLADADREHILEAVEQTGWMIAGQDGAQRSACLNSKLSHLMSARPIWQLPDEQCHAAANC